MGDKIVIYSKEDIQGKRSNTVKILGSVNNPGEYSYFENMTYLDLLYKGGGVKNKKYLNSIYMDRSDIVRQNLVNNSKDIIMVNLSEVLDSTNQVNPKLDPGDEVHVYSDILLENDKFLSIEGAVNSPGVYEYIEGMNLFDLLLKSGNVIENVFRYRVDIASIDPFNSNEDLFASINTYSFNKEKKRNLNKSYINGSGESKIILKPFDLVTIRPDPVYVKQSTVSIDGLVYYPGNYVLSNREERVSDII